MFDRGRVGEDESDEHHVAFLYHNSTGVRFLFERWAASALSSLSYVKLLFHFPSGVYICCQKLQT